MMQAVKNGWTRAIGVDDYKPAQIENLKGTKPAVNMCSCARPLSLSLSHYYDGEAFAGVETAEASSHLEVLIGGRSRLFL